LHKPHKGTVKSLMTPKERLLSKIIRNGECWEYSAYRNKHGYGYFSINGKQIGAHRASWILHFGPIPEGVQVLHRCDNPPCFRPDHLFLGNQTANMQDCLTKGRFKAPPKLEYCRKGLHKMEGYNVLHREIRKNFDKTKTYYGRQCRACKTDADRAKRNLNRLALAAAAK
jgi:hypothetical protein